MLLCFIWRVSSPPISRRICIPFFPTPPPSVTASWTQEFNRGWKINYFVVGQCYKSIRFVAMTDHYDVRKKITHSRKPLSLRFSVFSFLKTEKKTEPLEALDRIKNGTFFVFYILFYRSKIKGMQFNLMLYLGLHADLMVPGFISLVMLFRTPLHRFVFLTSFLCFVLI